MRKRAALIETRRGPNGETAFSRGTRTRVSAVVRLYDLMTREVIIERLLESMPHLTAEQVEAALTYREEHGEELACESAKEQAVLAETKW